MKVILNYFKPSGKWYSEAEYNEQDSEKGLLQIWEDIQKMSDAGKLPGLVEGHSEFMIHIDVPDHKHAHPYIFIPWWKPKAEPQTNNF